MKKIKCLFRTIEKYTILAKEDEKLREGRYHGSFFWNVKEFGQERWVIAAHIIGLDIDSLLEEGMSEEDIVNGCVAHLNIKPPRKKYAKKEPKRPYGNLELYRFNVSDGWRGDGKKFISTLLVTDDRKNKKFWGEGQKVSRFLKVRRSK